MNKAQINDLLSLVHINCAKVIDLSLVHIKCAKVIDLSLVHIKCAKVIDCTTRLKSMTLAHLM
jgi:hypothetical protein